LAAGQAPAQSTPAPGASEFDDVTDLDLERLLAAPTVESASKRSQSLEEAPGSVTVIQGVDLIGAGSVTLADVLRGVPGAWIYQTDANMFHVGLRGMGMMNNSSLLVLINGRRFYDLMQGYAPWAALPLHVGEIERIEILRGPGAPLYGADALNGVINIVTKHAKDHVGADAAFAVGVGMLPDEPQTPERQQLKNGGSGYVSGNLRTDDARLAARGTLGFNQLGEWQDIDDKGEPDVYRHGSVGYHGALTLDWVPSRDVQAWLDARHVLAERQVSFGNTPQASQIISEQSASAGLEARRFLVEPLTFKLSGNVRRAHLEGRPITLERHIADVSSYQLMVQTDLSLWDGRDVLTAGLEGSYRHGSYWDGSDYQGLYGAAVLQNEAALLDRRLVISVAGRYEGIRYRAGEIATRYVNFNPRASVIVRLSDRHTVRASAATAYRTPTPFQTFVKVLPDRYPDPIPPAYAVVGNPSLIPEQMRAVEVGYRGRLAYWLRVDATAFAQSATGLMQADDGALPFQTKNALDETHFGVELGSQIRTSGSLSGYLNYAFLRAHSVEADAGAVRFPPHLLSGGASARPIGKLRVRGDFNYVAEVVHTRFNSGSLLNVQYRIPPQTILNLKLSHPLGVGLIDLFAVGTNLLAPWKDRARLHQYSNTTAAPIGMILMIGVEIGLR
jgi:iron complex outermembrane receptor protein